MLSKKCLRWNFFIFRFSSPHHSLFESIGKVPNVELLSNRNFVGVVHFLPQIVQFITIFGSDQSTSTQALALVNGPDNISVQYAWLAKQNICYELNLCTLDSFLIHQFRQHEYTSLVGDTIYNHVCILQCRCMALEFLWLQIANHTNHYFSWSDHDNWLCIRNQDIHNLSKISIILQECPMGFFKNTYLLILISSCYRHSSAYHDQSKSILPKPQWVRLPTKTQ